VYTCLFKLASGKKDADPYLDKVRWQGVKICLYDDRRKGDYDMGLGLRSMVSLRWRVTRIDFRNAHS
jgi:hypothetical protein